MTDDAKKKKRFKMTFGFPNLRLLVGRHRGEKVGGSGGYAPEHNLGVHSIFFKFLYGYLYYKYVLVFLFTRCTFTDWAAHKQRPGVVKASDERLVSRITRGHRVRGKRAREE